VASALGCSPDEVLVCSTGLIGIPLPLAPFTDGVPALAASLASTTEAGELAADAIMTTDTVRKESVAVAGGVTVGGMAKGAAMLAPNMATMLAVLTTDAKVEQSVLQKLLSRAMDHSFHRISVDGCTSTNDTVIILASGKADTEIDATILGDLITRVCEDLAEQMVRDAEGATKLVHVTVEGAAGYDDAAKAARRIAEAQLTKCSWYGKDPYWGRIVSEAASAGAAFDIDKVSVAYGGIVVAAGGVAVDHDREAVAQHMQQDRIDVTVDLGLGDATCWMLTNDLTHAYVDENMGTS
jgi:glutamate N-acetyltransferase/amino-acid N-acetyltransferase